MKQWKDFLILVSDMLLLYLENSSPNVTVDYYLVTDKERENFFFNNRDKLKNLSSSLFFLPFIKLGSFSSGDIQLANLKLEILSYPIFVQLVLSLENISRVLKAKIKEAITKETIKMYFLQSVEAPYNHVFF